ncbi:MAG TPA: ABC transporter permease [Thermodesulfobacteriota bacterium]
MRRPALQGGLVLVAVILLAAAAGRLWTPYDPDRPDFAVRLAPPSAAHPLGADHFGRDLLSRIMVGAGSAVAIGGAAVAIGLGVGALVGVAAGWRGGWLDEILMRPVEALAALPAVLLALLLATVLGPGGMAAVLAIGLASVPAFARLARASAIEQRGREYVESARALGVSPARLVVRHVVPNLAPPLLVLATAALATAILAEAALSYLGLGTQPPAASWGRMLREAQTFLALSPWPTLFPGLAIALAVLGFNLLGDGLRDLLDPRTRGGTGAPGRS